MQKNLSSSQKFHEVSPVDWGTGKHQLLQLFTHLLTYDQLLCSWLVLA